jgi:ubiquitin carboxyl-terminal hydrolase 14
LKLGKKVEEDGDAEMVDDETGQLDTVTRLFEVELESTVANTESEAEPEKTTAEKVLKLSCHIDNNNNPINNLQDGLDISLTGELEKFSEVLQRNAIFKKKSLVSKLPSYLCVQFVRFYWKKESNVGGTKAGKAKILRSVMYPRIFDIYSFCSPDLKKSLDHGREFEAKLREQEDKERLEGLKKAEEDSKPKDKEETEEEAAQRKKLVG